jgi:hypothetical protein
MYSMWRSGGTEEEREEAREKEEGQGYVMLLSAPGKGIPMDP